MLFPKFLITQQVTHLSESVPLAFPKVIPSLADTNYRAKGLIGINEREDQRKDLIGD
jgi:hypothetical protein